MGQKKDISIFEIAKITGFSPSTVSRVLAGKNTAAVATREKILAAAQKFNFKPATCPRRRTVALVVNLSDDRYSFYFDMMLHGFIAETTARGLDIKVYTRSNYQTLNPMHLDGMVVIPWNAETAPWAASVPNLPCVLVNSYAPPGCLAVCSDHYASGRMAAEFFIAQNVRGACVTLDGADWGSMERLRGFRETLAAWEGDFAPGRAAIHDWEGAENGRPTPPSDLLATRPRGVFMAGEDQLPLYLETIRRLGMRVPEDLEIVSMANPFSRAYISSRVTTISQPFAAMRAAAIDLLLQWMDGEPVASPPPFANAIAPRAGLGENAAAQAAIGPAPRTAAD